MEALGGGRGTNDATTDDVAAEGADRPILRLVREPVVRPRPLPEPESPPADTAAVPATESAPTAPAVAPGPAAPAPTPRPAPAPVYGIPADASGVHPKKGVCAAYYVSHACWEVPDAYCNQALHVCMLRDCPVYNLNREELERRFAAKFAHLW
ncbi:MAG: hypothetical protein QN178_01520 [Armatimonadota bacterium]|nr:hypothetical protein [Armatimonadota bacterium]